MVSKAQQLVDIFEEMYGSEPRTVSRDEVKRVAKENDIPSLYRIINKDNLAEDGFYHFPPVGKSSVNSGGASRANKVNIIPTGTPQRELPMDSNTSNTTAEILGTVHGGFKDSLIPTKDPLFIPFGHYKSVESILKSRMFYPVFITGLSGNGKTHMVEQACGKTNREVIRVNISIETDEDDLIGGFRLVDGETKFFKGPVIAAMEQGAVLLLDEIDLGNPARLMCLQSILEGSGYFIKKTGEFINPQPGFTVVATANTKGQGSDTGQFIGTNVLNEAFLERFPITLEQEYPSPAMETKILKKVFASLELEESDFIKKLIDWADIVRKTYMDGGVDSVISTRRLIHIAKAYAIFGDRMEAIKMCTNRFDEETKVAFAELYASLDKEVDLNADPEPTQVEF